MLRQTPGAPYCTSMEKLNLETSPILRDETLISPPVMHYGCHFCVGNDALDQKARKIYSIDSSALAIGIFRRL